MRAWNRNFNLINEDGEFKLAVFLEHRLVKDSWKDRYLLFDSKSSVFKKYVKEQIIMTNEFEKAPATIPFLESEYFQGLCELAVASHMQLPVFVDEEHTGIFQSLFFKRIYSRKLNEDKSWSIAEFEMKNRYLYNYNSLTKQYESKKDENYTAFCNKVRELAESKNFKVFSLENKALASEALADIIGG